MLLILKHGYQREANLHREHKGTRYRYPEEDHCACGKKNSLAKQGKVVLIGIRERSYILISEEVKEWFKDGVIV